MPLRPILTADKGRLSEASSRERAMAGSTADRFYALDRLIAEGEKRCAEQVALIERLNENGQSTTRAMGVLRDIKNTLASLRCRRSYLQVIRMKP